MRGAGCTSTDTTWRAGTIDNVSTNGLYTLRIVAVDVLGLNVTLVSEVS